jgi:predicted membrane protein
MMQTRPPVQRIRSMELHPVIAGVLYIIALAVIVLTVRYWTYEGTQRFYSPGIGCGSLLLISLYLYIKKPRARHHAAILSGICLLVLGFVILLTLKNPYAP